MRKFAAISLFFIILMLCACGVKASPERTIKRFEKALQNIDIDSMIDCVEPRTAEGIRSAANIAGGLFGFDSKDIFNLLYLAVGIAKQTNIQELTSEMDVFNSASFTIMSTDYNKDKSKAAVAVEFSFDGESTTGIINMIKSEGEWYIQILNDV